MSGGKKLLFTFVLAAVAFVYQYVRSPSFRRQCGSVFAEWRGNGGGHTPSPLRGTPPVSDIMGTILFQASPGLLRGIVL